MTTMSVDGATNPRHVSISRAVGSRAPAVAVWATHISAAALLLLAGVAKLAGTADTMGVYEAAGIGQLFRCLAGSIEVMTGLSLLIPVPAFVAGIGLALTVVEAGLTSLALQAA
jgi:hypothetical protein